MKSLPTQARPRVIAIEAQGLSAFLRLECEACQGVFEVQQGSLAGVPLSVRTCPACGIRLEIRPELYELALHEAGMRASPEGSAFYAPIFSGAGAGFAKRSIADGRPCVVWAPAIPRADASLHGDLARRYIAMARLFVSAATEYQGQARFLVRPDNAEADMAGPEDAALLIDWLQSLAPEPIEIGLHQDFDLGAADVILTHQGAPFIDKALRAGKEVLALQLFKRAGDENLPEGALAIRDGELTPTLGQVLGRAPSAPAAEPNSGVEIGAPEKRREHLRVLFCYRDDVDQDGGASLVMKKTAKALIALGHEVDISFDLHPDPTGYDLVHAFNIWHPESALEQLAHLKEKGATIVWSPIYLDLSEHVYFASAVSVMINRKDIDRDLLLTEIEAGRLKGSDDKGRFEPREALPGYFLALETALTAVDHVCVTSSREAQIMSQHSGIGHFDFTVTPHGVDGSAFARAKAGDFVTRFGLEDFILCVGAVERRKNQLLLVKALKDSGRPIVLIGPTHEPDYTQLIEEEGGDAVHILGRQDHAIVASALKAAAVHVLPSFTEGAALANLEAAAAGCPMVVSNRSSEFEYFGDVVFYCDPGHRGSIRDAVARATRDPQGLAWKRERLQARMLESFTWDHSARVTELAYRSLIHQ